MGRSSRAESLRELGYEEPFDESPVDVPDGWHGGEVVNTGGHTMCRVWKTWEIGERDRDTEFEVIYNTADAQTVSLHAYTWNEGFEGYTLDHEIRSEKPEEHTDHAQAEVARKLMVECDRS